jgi:cystathionine beta-synthase
MSAYRTREIALKEAIMGGYTTGAVTGIDAICTVSQLTQNDVIVLIYPDHGSRYITKVYSDKWMAEQGFVNNCVHNYDEVFKTEFIK